MKPTNNNQHSETEPGTEAQSTATTKGTASTKKKNNANESKLEKFFVEQLKDIYWSEKHLVEALSAMEAACTTEELKEAFSDHLHITKKQVKRLEKVFKIFGQQPEAKKCDAMAGLVKEAEKIIADTEEGTLTRDAALIIAAQKVEHYEIATYGGLVQLAITMDQSEAADLLETTLMEEEQTDQDLTYVAEAFINVGAEEEDKYSWKQMKLSESGDF